MATITREQLIDLVRPNFTPLSDEGREQLRQRLIASFYSDAIMGGPGKSLEYVTSENGRRDIEVHLDGRLNDFRSALIPWLAYRCGLAGRSVVEVGFGTGSSTPALAEQGARVTGVDIESEAPVVAGLRCELHGVAQRVRLHVGNAAEIENLYPSPRAGGGTVTVPAWSSFSPCSST